VVDFPSNREISEETLVPCYFFFGEEQFLAWEFEKRIEELLISPDNYHTQVERLSREEHSWAQIIDRARSMPFLFSAKRIIKVAICGKKQESLSPAEMRELNDYLSSPTPQTVLIIVLAGKVTWQASIVKFFAAFPSSAVCVKEMKTLRGRALVSWVDNQFRSRGKSAAPEAQRRLIEIIGDDLGRLNSEIEKISIYLGEKRLADADDVNDVCGWFKSFHEWEMQDNLENADCERCFRVLDNFFRGGTRPEYVLGIFVRFFRDLFMAKVWLREKSKDKKEIFRELRPQIQEKFGDLYKTKFGKFFAVVDGMNRQDIDSLLEKLQEVDLKFKTTGLSLQNLLEGFIWDYCRLRHGVTRPFSESTSNSLADSKK